MLRLFLVIETYEIEAEDEEEAFRGHKRGETLLVGTEVERVNTSDGRDE